MTDSEDTSQKQTGYRWRPSGLGTGLAIGLALGFIFENMGLGVAVGVVIGLGLRAIRSE